MEEIIILIVILILAAIILGVVGFFIAVKSLNRANRHDRALSLLQQKLSHLEALLRASGAAEEERAQEVPAPLFETTSPAPEGDRAPDVPAPPAPDAEQPGLPEADREPGPTDRVVPPVPHGPSMNAAAAFPDETTAKPSDADWAGFEQMLGKRWMTWVGVSVLFLATAFFLKYAFEQGWINETARVVMGIVLGTVLVTAGDRFIRRKMETLGKGLIGGGVAILYLSLYAAFAFYELVAQSPAFGAMALITAACMTLSVLHDSRAISVLAVLGGMLTPVLVNTGEDSRDALFTYVLLLDLGVMGVAFFRKWDMLDVLAFLGTAALFAGWYLKFYESSAVVPAMLWLGVFYFLFMLLPLVTHFRLQEPIKIERWLIGLANAALVFTCAYKILYSDYRYALGAVALVMAASYLVLGIRTRKRIAGDTKALFSFMALSVTFLTIAVPLHMELNGITLLWAVEGPLLLYLGYRYDYRPIRTGAFAILLLTQMRIFLRHWPLHEAAFTLLLNRRFAIAMSAVLSAAAIAVIHKAWTHRRTKPDKMLMITSAIGAGYIALVTMHAELGKWLESDVLMSRGVVSVLWLMGTVAFLGVGVAVKSEIVRKAGIPALATGALLAARLYATAMEEPSMLYLNLRFIVGIAAVLTVFAYAMTLYRRKDICAAREQSLSKFLLCAGGAALLVLLSVETYTFFSREVTGARKARWVARMSLSIVWVVYAIGALLLGFWKRLRPLRLAALGLFGLTVGKLILMDITGIREIYRILSFFITGTLLIAAAYLYSKFEKRIEDLLGEKE